MYSVNYTVNSTQVPGETCPGFQGGLILLSFNKHLQNCLSIVDINVSTTSESEAADYVCFLQLNILQSKELS